MNTQRDRDDGSELGEQYGQVLPAGTQSVDTGSTRQQTRVVQLCYCVNVLCFAARPVTLEQQVAAVCR